MSEARHDLQPPPSRALEQALARNVESLEREYAQRRDASACGRRVLAGSVAKAYRLAIANEAERLAKIRQHAQPADPY